MSGWLTKLGYQTGKPISDRAQRYRKKDYTHKFEGDFFASGDYFFSLFGASERSGRADCRKGRQKSPQFRRMAGLIAGEPMQDQPRADIIMAGSTMPVRSLKSRSEIDRGQKKTQPPLPLLSSAPTNPRLPPGPATTQSPQIGGSPQPVSILHF